MVEVGVRELKARLSYYLQLMQTGEEIAIKMRHRIIGFFSSRRPSPPHPAKRASKRDLHRRFEQLKAQGFIVRGGPYRPLSFKPVRLKGGVTTTQIIRGMRDEDL